MANIGFIGLGNMGLPMARNLLGAGHEVTGFDLSEDACAALAGVVNLLDPDLIVLGGGLSNLDHLHDRLPGAMRGHVFSDVFETPILNNRLGDSAGVIGAAWLWPEGPQ